MIKSQRKRLKELAGQVSDILTTLESIKEQEQDKYDNLPVGLQDSEWGEELEQGIDVLDSVINSLSDAETVLIDFSEN